MIKKEKKKSEMNSGEMRLTKDDCGYDKMKTANEIVRESKEN
jgi:hypothetical protein